jgi:hypothetical protein
VYGNGRCCANIMKPLLSSSSGKSRCFYVLIVETVCHKFLHAFEKLKSQVLLSDKDRDTSGCTATVDHF